MPYSRHAARDISYVLDGDTRLVSVGGDWERFAVENGALELLLPEPLGRPMDSFIADATTAQIWSDIYARVKATERPLSFPLRCDGPDMIRELTITVTGTGGGFLIRSSVVSEMPRGRIPFPVAPPGKDDDAFVRSCAWCKRIDVRGKWYEMELAVLTLSLFRRERLPAITHGMCEDCLAGMEQLLSA